MAPSDRKVLSRRRWLRDAAIVGGGMGLLGCGASPGRATVAAPAAPAVPAPPPQWLASVRERLIDEARTLSTQPFGAPRRELPPALDGLDYDQYRSIRFRPDRSLWRAEDLPFQVQFFHLGFYYREPVHVRELTPEGEREIAFTPDWFEYPEGPLSSLNAPDLGFAGLRLHTPINNPDYYDELAVFQGASYFRSLGQNQVYGLSARGLAIDTGESTPEEFPRFDAYWLVRPEPGDRTVRLFARLDSPRATGAYEFELEPGAPTTRITVHAHVFLRDSIAVLGLAPLTSMYLFGEDRPGRFGDFRPEVHDSDGLHMLASNGERVWRPLRNPTSTTVTQHRLDDPRGFGLLQRDRNYPSYLDLEAHYHRRPSAWVEPLGSWGPGSVRLLEIATRLETDDNIAAMWVPDRVPAAGLSFSYRIHLGDDVTPSTPASSSRVRATRVGSTPEGTAPGTRFVLEWDGQSTEAQRAEDLEIVVTAQGGTISQRRVEADPNLGVVRSSFDLAPEADAIELRAFLRRGDDAISETWSYLWQPSART